MSLRLAAVLLLSLLGPAFAIAQDAHPSTYAGEQRREIKALSPDEIAAYLEGRGMGWRRQPNSITTPARRTY